MVKPLSVFEAPLQGISVVEASAGTGKTYNITSLYVRAIIEKSLIPADILVLTYTEAATAELKFRLRRRLREAYIALTEGYEGSDAFLNTLLQQNYINPDIKLRNAIIHFDEAAVFTIHGFCNRLLNENNLQFRVPANFEVVKDESDLIQECVDEYWRNYIRSAKTDPYRALIYEFLVDEGFSPDELQGIIYEIISRPYANLEPPAKELNMRRIYNLADELFNKFKEVSYYWKEEGEILEQIFRGDELKRNIYQKKVEDQYWALLMDWLKQEQPSVHHFEKLGQFGLKISRSGKKGTNIPELKLCRAIDQFIGIAEQLKRLKAAFIFEAINEVKEQLDQIKSSRNLLSYNDFLSRVNDALVQSSSGDLPRKLSNKYPVALVDEFQDTDPVQYSIFRCIYGQREQAALFMIGDPKQAIYGFRGADIHTYFKARKDAHASQIYSLSANYRSSKQMIEAVNEIFGHAPSSFLLENFEFNPAQFPQSKSSEPALSVNGTTVDKPMRLISVPGEDHWNKPDYTQAVIESVVSEVLKILNEPVRIGDDEVKEEDIAILVRKTAQGELIQDKLREHGLKSVLKSKTSVFKSREADELFLLLKSIQHISYEPGIRAALATDLVGYNAHEIQELLEDEQQWAEVYHNFMEFKQLWEDNGVEAAIEAIFSAFNTHIRLAEEADAERRITNVRHISDLLATAESRQQIYGKNLLKWLYRKIKGNYKETEEEELKLESDENLIQISTIHASKGLEYPIVFCPFLWDAPTQKDRNRVLRFSKNEQVYLDFNVGIKDDRRLNHTYLDYKEELAESIRLSYVALTRAAYGCYIHFPDAKEIERSPVAGILEGGKQTNKQIRTKVLKEDNEAAFSYEQLLKQLKQFKFVEVREPDYHIEEYMATEQDTRGAKLIPAISKRKNLDQVPRLLSYSALSRNRQNQDDDGHDYDETIDPLPSKQLLDQRSRFTFPKGAKAGTFLHQLFEDVDFSDPDELENLVENELEAHGFDMEWKPIVSEWMDESLHHPLNEKGLKLANLKEHQLLKEMEFHFPVHELKSDKLWALLREKPPSANHREAISGYMKGFIDLTFKADGKFYILDYKSNYLGDAPEDYSKHVLKEEMMHSAYNLQYHIYTAALHRFLTVHQPSYNYGEHFGGVFYLYLRGIEKNKPGSGVYFDKPSLSVIRQFNKVFEQEGTV
ncbi:MAG: exodeoxyribonuclease V subunit beta [Balneolaceae bacterium]|nr:exodeoxyribonuclease V subunit beta [Balneolaceae bacterium]